MQEIIRSHTCPVVYLQNFAILCPKYEKKLSNYTIETYRPPKQKDYCVYVHDKKKNNKLTLRSVVNIAVKKRFYSPVIEQFETEIENKVKKEFKKFRSAKPIGFIEIAPVYQFIVNQLVRTPKFQEKLKKDQIFLKDMDEDEFKDSFFHFANVKKPAKVSKMSLQELQAGIITSNRLSEMLHLSQCTLATNFTDSQFITSDCPVVYNYVEFIPTVLKSQNKLEPSLFIKKGQSTIMFPISTEHLIIIQNFDTKRKELLIHYEDIYDESRIMEINRIFYIFADRHIILKNNNNDLIKKIRNECGDQIDREYQLLEQTYIGMTRGSIP